MFKSLFTRILMALSAMIILVMVSQFFYQTTSFSNNFVNERMRQMEKEANEINSLYVSFFETASSYNNDIAEIMWQDLEKSIGAIANIDSANIWIISSNGSLVAQYGDADNVEASGEELFEGFEAEIQAVLDGGTVKRTTPYKIANRDIPVVTYGQPLEYRGQIIGGVFIHVQEQQVMDNMRNIFGRIWIGVVLSIFAAVIMGSIYARIISRPMIELSNMAKRVAKGDFSVRARVRGKGEIADLERSFNTMVKELGQLEESRKTFIANVSHELRAPLASIQGFIQGMQDGTIEESRHEHYRGIVLAETARLSEMISELLTLSMMDDGKVQLNYSDFDINELLKRMLINFEPRISEKNIEMDIHLEEPVMIHADRDRIAQVITNLVDNAVKFTNEDGSIRVESTQKKNEAVITISNTGSRIAEADMKKIFDRFYRANEKARTPGTGTGLGLAICNKIIQLHQQKIMVKSNDELTSFSFTLQRAEKKKQ